MPQPNESRITALRRVQGSQVRRRMHALTSVTSLDLCRGDQQSLLRTWAVFREFETVVVVLLFVDLLFRFYGHICVACIAQAILALNAPIQ